MIKSFPEKSARSILFFILLASAVIRFLYLWQLQQTSLIKFPYIEAEIYHEWAIKIVEKGWLGDSAFFQSPLYPYILAVFYKMIGPDMGLFLWFQGCVSILSIWLIFLLGKELFNQKVGLLSAALGTFYGTFVFYSGLLLKATLATFFTCLFLFLILRACKTPTIRNFLISGLTLGVAITLRGNFLLIFIVFLVFVFFSSPVSIRLRNTSIFFLGVALVITPITLRNYYLEKDFVLLTYNGGPVFFIGNNPMATGVMTMFNFVRAHPRFEEEDFTTRAEKVSGRKLKPSEVSHYWFKISLAYIFEKPMDYLKLQFKKLLQVINNYETPSNYNFYFIKTLAPALNFGFVSFGFLLVFASAGIFIGGGRSKPYLVFYLFILFYLVSVVLFHVNSRHRLPLVVGLIPFAGFFLSEGLKKITEMELKRLLVLIFIIGLISFGVFRPIQNSPFYKSHYHYALANKSSGLWEEAITELKKALVINPIYTEALFGLAMIYMEQGFENDAIAHFKKTLETNPKLLRVRVELGKVFLQKGLLKKAETQFQRVLLQISELDKEKTKQQELLGISRS